MQCPHCSSPRIIIHGRTRRGAKRFLCRHCRKTFTIRRDAKSDWIRRLILAGWSDKAIARTLGVHPTKVQTVRLRMGLPAPRRVRCTFCDRPARQRCMVCDRPACPDCLMSTDGDGQYFSNIVWVGGRPVCLRNAVDACPSCRGWRGWAVEIVQDDTECDGSGVVIELDPRFTEGA